MPTQPVPAAAIGVPRHPAPEEINIEDLLHQALDFISVARLALGSQWVGADDLLSITVVLEHAEKGVTSALAEVQRAG